MDYGFVRAAAAIPNVKIADCVFNVEHTAQLIKEASSKDIQIVAFPELGITGYTCGDLFEQELLLEEAEKNLGDLLDMTSSLSILCVVGMPVQADNQLFNAAIVFQHGKILGVVPKSYLPNYKEFYEERWFASAHDTSCNEICLCGQEVPFGNKLLFSGGNLVIGIELCEDLWVPIPPSSDLCLNGANVIINLSASNELIGKHDYLESLIKQQSARCMSAYVYASAGFGESSTDVVFSGNGIIAENGELLAESTRFCMDEQLIYTEIDIERLQNDRRQNSSYMSCRTEKDNNYRTVKFELPTTQVNLLSRKISAYPFVPSENENCLRDVRKYLISKFPVWQRESCIPIRNRLW